MSVTCPKDFELTVHGNTTPCDLSVVDNTFIGEFSPNVGDAALITEVLAAATLGNYEWRYTGGAWYDDDNPFPSTWKLLTFEPYYNGVPSGGSLLLNQYSGANQAAVEAGGLADITVAMTFLHTTGNLGVRITKGSPGVPAGFIAGAPNPTWSITRISKPLVTPPARLRVVAASWTALAPLLVPLPGAGAGGATPAYDGTMPAQDIFNLASDWTWRFGSASQLFTRAISDAELYHTTFEPLSTTGCAWICGFGYSSGGSWAGIGGGGGISGGGPLPHGRFFFTPGLFSFAVDGQYADVRVATTAVLPDNTRVGNVLTADVVGAFPTIDGISLAVGNRILVKNEAAGLKNGVYTVTSLGSAATFWSLTRATDMDTSPEVTQGIFVKVTEGTALQGTYWRQVTLDPITLNTTALSWLQIPPYIDVESY